MQGGAMMGRDKRPGSICEVSHLVYAGLPRPQRVLKADPTEMEALS